MAISVLLALVAIWANIGGAVQKANEPNLKLVATANGKSFFADRLNPLGWKESGEYCQIMGMQLASITTQNQADALDKAYNIDDFHGPYWTAGRDARLHRQFSWNDTGLEISSQHLQIQPYGSQDYKTCILYSSSYQTSGIMLYDCESPFGVLCESAEQK